MAKLYPRSSLEQRRGMRGAETGAAGVEQLTGDRSRDRSAKREPPFTFGGQSRLSPPFVGRSLMGSHFLGGSTRHDELLRFLSSYLDAPAAAVLDAALPLRVRPSP